MCQPLICDILLWQSEKTNTLTFTCYFAPKKQLLCDNNFKVCSERADLIPQRYFIFSLITSQQSCQPVTDQNGVYDPQLTENTGPWGIMWISRCQLCTWHRNAEIRGQKIHYSCLEQSPSHQQFSLEVSHLILALVSKVSSFCCSQSLLKIYFIFKNYLFIFGCTGSLLL